MSRTSGSSSTLHSGMFTAEEIPVNVAVNYHSDIDVPTENSVGVSLIDGMFKLLI